MSDNTYGTDVEKHWCGCPHFKYQKKPISQRMCKHLLRMGAKYIPALHDWPKKVPKPHIMLYGDNVKKYVKNGWYCSEKLDGVRGYYDGTRMISRNGNTIDIPDRIRKYLSKQYKVDGEFFKTRKTFHDVVKAIQSPKSSKDWEGIEFYVFDIHNSMVFFDRYMLIHNVYPFYCKQYIIHTDDIDRELKLIENKGGEGLILRNPQGLYQPGRSNDIIKLKPIHTGHAKYLGDNTFKEMNSNIIFKIRVSKKQQLKNGTQVSFIYRDRTLTNKPKFPSLIT